MSLTLQQFIAQYNGKGIDFDHAFGCQCMDLAQQYNRDAVGAPPLCGNAINVWTTYPTAYYDRIANTPDNYPLPGDVVIWGGPNNTPGVNTTQYGHIAVCVQANAQQFTSFDQNWPDGSFCHEQPHNYVAVLGWLHPKSAVTSPSRGVSPTPHGVSPAQAYVVRPGDTLGGIANAHHLTLQALEAANAQIRNVNQIVPGEVVHLPAHP